MESIAGGQKSELETVEFVCPTSCGSRGPSPVSRRRHHPSWSHHRWPLLWPGTIAQCCPTTTLRTQTAELQVSFHPSTQLYPALWGVQQSVKHSKTNNSSSKPCHYNYFVDYFQENWKYCPCPGVQWPAPWLDMWPPGSRAPAMVSLVPTPHHMGQWQGATRLQYSAHFPHSSFPCRFLVLVFLANCIHNMLASCPLVRYKSVWKCLCPCLAWRENIAP